MFIVPHYRSFHDTFFARSMRQQFNEKVVEFESDENEPAIVKYVRVLHKDRLH